MAGEDRDDVDYCDDVLEAEETEVRGSLGSGASRAAACRSRLAERVVPRGVVTFPMKRQVHAGD